VNGPTKVDNNPKRTSMHWQPQDVPTPPQWIQANTKAPPPLDGNIDDTNNMIIECTSDDLLGDYN
jgi:hypothetical protein